MYYCEMAAGFHLCACIICKFDGSRTCTFLPWTLKFASVCSHTMTKRPNEDQDVEMECAARSKGSVSLMTLASGKWQCTVCSEWHTARSYSCKFWVWLGNDKHFLYSCERCTLQYQHRTAQQYQQAEAFQIQGSQTASLSAGGSSSGAGSAASSYAGGSASGSGSVSSGATGSGAGFSMDLD